MPSHFEHTFKRVAGYREVSSPAADLVNAAVTALQGIEQFRALPTRSQNLLIAMSSFMVMDANGMREDDRSNENGNFWGLYVVGSRARGDVKPDSDLDLLSVGTFYNHLGFLVSPRGAFGVAKRLGKVWEGYEVEKPDELPSEYNVGHVDRKYLLRGTPRIKKSSIKMIYPKPEPALPVDLSVVDLTFTDVVSLEDFAYRYDIDNSGVALPKIPLIELVVESSVW